MARQQLHLLLVNNNRSDFLVIQHGFSQLVEYQVTLEWASTTAEALIKLTQQVYTVCLVDFIVDEDSGLVFVSRAMAEGHHLPFILLFSKGYQTLGPEALAIGVVDYLIKEELDGETLARALRYALNYQKAQESEHQLKDLADILEQHVAARTRELATLYQIAALSSSTQELRPMLEKTLRLTLAAIGGQAGAIHLVTGPGQNFELAVQHNLPPEMAGQLNVLAVEDGLAGLVIGHGQPLLISNLMDEPRLPHFIPADHLQVYLGTTMQSRGSVMGLLSLFGNHEREFQRTELEFLASIADHIGIVIENYRLLRQLHPLDPARNS